MEREGLGEGSLAGPLVNQLRDSLEILDNIVVCDANKNVSKTSQILLAGRVIFLTAIVAFAIQFDNQPGFSTEEIDGVRFDRVLTAELESTKLATTQHRPQ
jgi:hypothetical protein